MLKVSCSRKGSPHTALQYSALLKTARMFGRAPKFTVEQTGGKMFVVAGAGIIPSIVDAALKSIGAQGVQTVSALCQAVPEIHQRRTDPIFVRQVLNTRRDVRWLDDDEKIFWLASVPRNPVVRSLRKVLCYASPVSLPVLHKAIARIPSHRLALSRPQLARFCEQVLFCRVADGSVERIAPLSAAKLISSPEKTVCRILRRNGNELPIQRLQRLCAAAGVQKPNLWRIVLYSPLISRPAPRIYRVITASSDCTPDSDAPNRLRVISRSAEDRVRLHCTRTP